MAPSRATGRDQAPTVDDAGAVARQKLAAAHAAAAMVEDGMRVGLGTGSTVAYLLPALAQRELHDIACVATSPATGRRALELGLTLRELDELGQLDIAIDGADQIDPRGWLVKGGGAAHTREKIVAYAARSFIVIASAEKAVAELSPPIPLELVAFGVASTLARLGRAQLRDSTPPSPDGGLIGDYLGPVEDPRHLAARLSAEPGVVEHGLFAPEMVSEILIGREQGVERRTGARA